MFSLDSIHTQPQLRMERGGLFEPPQAWQLGPDRTRQWPDLLLWYLKEGSGTLHTPKGPIPISAGSCLLLLGRRDFTIVADRPTPHAKFTHYWAHFDILDKAQSIIPIANIVEPAYCRRVSHHAFFEGLMARAVKAFEADCREEANSWLSMALLDVIKTDRALASPTKHVDSQLTQLLNDINEHPEQNWTITSMLERIGGSRTRLYQQVMNQTGRSPQQVVIDARMRQARTLLLEASNDIGWIATQLGYRDLYFFSRQFKQIHGCSPSAYRKQ